MPERLIGKSRLPHDECVPFLPHYLLIDVDNIQMLVHPQLMAVVANEHSPMLRRIWVFANLLGDQLS